MNPLRTGVFVDLENLRYTGGHALDFEYLLKIIDSHNLNMIRGNVYSAFDAEVEARNGRIRDKAAIYWDHMSILGFFPCLKQVKSYSDGNSKANADVDIAVDSLMMASNFDAIFLASGDGDFVPLVKGLQSLGKRVYVLSLHMASNDLKEVADVYIPGLAHKGLVPGSDTYDPERSRGIITRYNPIRKFGFIKHFTGLGPLDFESIYFREQDYKFVQYGSTTVDTYLDRAIQTKKVVTFKIIVHGTGRASESRRAVEIEEFLPEKRFGGSDERFCSTPLQEKV